MIPLTLTFGKDQEVLIDHVIASMPMIPAVKKTRGKHDEVGLVHFHFEFADARQIYVFGYLQASQSVSTILSLMTPLDESIVKRAR